MFKQIQEKIKNKNLFYPLFYIVVFIFILLIFYIDYKKIEQKNEEQKVDLNELDIIKKYYVKNSSNLKNNEIAKICIDNRLYLYTNKNIIQVFDNNNTIVSCDLIHHKKR